MRIGYLSSTFDLLNVADLDVISQVLDRCDRLVIGVFSDECAERLQGRPPVIGLEERLALVRHVRGVADVVVHDDVDLGAFGDEVIVFGVDAVGYEDHDGETAEVVWLTPERETASSALRDALASTPRTAVA